jgi:hypothetical protein
MNPESGVPATVHRQPERHTMTIMIGIDPHKATHTAVAVDDDENVLDEFKVRASGVGRPGVPAAVVG